MFPPASKLYHGRENPGGIYTDNSKQRNIQTEKRIPENAFSNHYVIILEKKSKHNYIADHIKPFKKQSF